MKDEWTCERETVLRVFNEMLSQVTGDGSKKRQAGLKPPWWRDDGHIPAMYRHLDQYESGERFSPDSGAHHLVSLAWRALAVAYRELHGSVDPSQ